MLSRTRRHVESERKLGEYFFLDTFNPRLQRVFEPFQRVFKVFPHSKGFQSVSKFQKLVQIFWETNRLYISRGNSCNLHLLSTSSPAKPWLSARNRKIGSISITWNRGKSGDIHTYIQTYIRSWYWRRKRRLVTYSTEISLLRNLVTSQQ